jgi:hypothetical protein
MKRFLLWMGVFGACSVFVLPIWADAAKGKRLEHAKEECEIRKGQLGIPSEAPGRGERHSTLNRLLNAADSPVRGRGKMHRAINQTLNAQRVQEQGRFEKRVR